MDFALGDTFSLKAAAIDPFKFDEKNPDDPKAILYYPGTQVKIIKINEDSVDLEFPSGEIVPHDPESILLFFNRVIDKSLIRTKVTTLYGTPPVELRKYMPAETDWKRNYRYKVIIESEDRGEKSRICPTADCYNDMTDIPKNNEGLQYCKQCDKLVTSVNPNVVNYD